MLQALLISVIRRPIISSPGLTITVVSASHFVVRKNVDQAPKQHIGPTCASHSHLQIVLTCLLNRGGAKYAILLLRLVHPKNSCRNRFMMSQVSLIGMAPMKSRLPISTPQWRRMSYAVVT